MPATQLSAKMGSDNSIFGMKETAKIGMSKFDFSKKNFTTIDLGSIVPVDWFNVYPGDKVKLNIRYLLDTFPLEVPPMNNYFVRTHWYFIKMSALWKGWNTFITRGRSGNIDLEIPSLSYSDAIASVQIGESEYRNYSCPNGLMDYLGIKPRYYNNDPNKKSYLSYLSNSSDNFTRTGFRWVTKFSILPLFAYQKICRFNYIATNLLQDNKVWLPDDLEDPWYIDYTGSNLSGPYFVPESATMPGGGKIAREVPSADSETGDNCVDLRQLRYGLFGRDYFTDAKPWLVRGAETNMDLTAETSSLISSINASIDSAESYFPIGPVGDEQIDRGPWDLGVQDVKNTLLPSIPSHVAIGATTVDVNNSISNAINSSIVEAVKSAGITLSPRSSTTIVKTAFTANTLRNLLAFSVWQERNTLTGGNYNQTIRVHWNHKPKSPEYEPLYIGGTSDLVNFGQVIQQSSSVNGSPLGTKAGQGSSVGGSEVFDFTADDYGIIMGVMIISPEVIYSQGVGHEWTDLTFDEQYQPEFANLGYQPILNKEIFPQGDSSDDDLFGYQTRYAYLKQRNNSVSGMFNLTPTQDATFGPYVQARRFSSLPELSEQFVTMSPDNVDRSFLSFSNLPAFKLQFASDVSLVRALPYQSTPETFGF